MTTYALGTAVYTTAATRVVHQVADLAVARVAANGPVGHHRAAKAPLARQVPFVKR